MVFSIKRLSMKIFIPVQVVPFPEYPLKHVQLLEPSVLVQLAFKSHSLADAEEHSSISVQNNMKM